MTRSTREWLDGYVKALQCGPANDDIRAAAEAADGPLGRAIAECAIALRNESWSPMNIIAFLFQAAESAQAAGLRVSVRVFWTTRRMRSEALRIARRLRREYERRINERTDET